MVWIQTTVPFNPAHRHGASAARGTQFGLGEEGEWGTWWTGAKTQLLLLLLPTAAAQGKCLPLLFPMAAWGVCLQPVLFPAALRSVGNSCFLLLPETNAGCRHFPCAAAGKGGSSGWVLPLGTGFKAQAYLWPELGQCSPQPKKVANPCSRCPQATFSLVFPIPSFLNFLR